MTGASFTFARIYGAPVRAHVSLLLVLFVFLAPAFSEDQPGRVGLTRAGLVLWSTATAFAFFGSILLHELGHVLQARRERMEIHGVTLWALGGVAHLSGGAPSPGQEFRVAAAGPAVTAVLAVLLNALPALAHQPPGRAGAGTALGVAEMVGRAQIFLLGFNLIPAFPLDGGRMFLGVAWRLRDNLTYAIKAVSAVGKAFGGILLLVSAIGYLSPQLTSLLPAAFRINGLAGLFLGWLIYDANRSPSNLIPAAGGAKRGRGLVVADFVNRNFVIAEPEMTVAALLRALEHLHIRPIALVIKDGRPLGMISRRDAEQVREDERESKPIHEVMVAKDDIRTVKATDPLSAARRVLEDGPETAVVLKDDVVVGLVSVSDIAHAMVYEQS